MELFLYGTLTADCDNPVASWLHRHLEPGRPALVRGRLYAVADPRGWYPGLIADPAGGQVHGWLHRTRPSFGAQALQRLDRYEGFDPACPQESEYLRIELTAMSEGRERAAIAYVWTALPSNFEILNIIDGSFTNFLRECGGTPFV